MHYWKIIVQRYFNSNQKYTYLLYFTYILGYKLFSLVIISYYITHLFKINMNTELWVQQLLHNICNFNNYLY